MRTANLESDMANASFLPLLLFLVSFTPSSTNPQRGRGGRQETVKDQGVEMSS